MSGIFAVLVQCYSLYNLLIKTDSTVICVLCMFVVSHFLKKNCRYVNWLNFVYCLKFPSLKPHLNK